MLLDSGSLAREGGPLPEGDEDEVEVEAEAVQSGTTGAGGLGLLTEAKMAAPDSGEIGILTSELFCNMNSPSRSTRSLLALKKSAPNSGN